MGTKCFSVVKKQSFCVFLINSNKNKNLYTKIVHILYNQILLNYRSYNVLNFIIFLNFRWLNPISLKYKRMMRNYYNLSIKKELFTI